ncbi:disulfide bond formation protein B [Acinetobacter rudis]|uniref:Disulfide bond formation protein B n=1 Tax=Acinetobacter rudis TaxID=632955 RepID=A0AAW8JDK2_9GAMM|nr:disulfide bond formation protein B [Acinetobacter rudis]MDQ8937022.1 disulfide bond formation protein B [Acinetobacter rudis]MDQ8952510.1 disulfide bond formation protein B [Acinetobacter rudis]MDQ9019217.1 disulfide bond formation protein B [Acinetobacter rudis]
MQWRQYRIVSGFLFLASVIGMAFALYLEHVKGFEPCPLCVFQRVGLIGLGFFSLIAFLHNPQHVFVKRLYAGLGTLSILWSAGVAMRHVWMQNLPADQVPTCGPGLNYLLEAFPMVTVLKQVLSGSGECAVVDWSFLGFSLPVWSGVFFVFLSIISIWQLFRFYPNNMKKKK